MTVPATAQPATVEADDQAARLWSLLDPAFLAGAGWDPETQILTPPPDHPQLGYPICRVQGCETIAAYGIGLCSSCNARYRAGDVDLDIFMTSRAPRQRLLGDRPSCAISGCPRPAKTNGCRLCSSHETSRKQLGLTLSAFLARPDVPPQPDFGGCQVAACVRQAAARRRLCWGHDHRWRRERPDQDFNAWRLVAPPMTDGRVVVLRGLSPLVQAQMLYGLQERCRRSVKTKLEVPRRLCDRLRAQRRTSLLELDPAGLPEGPRGFLVTVKPVLARAFSSPETEQRKDVWDMAVFGYGQHQITDFTIISQRWLRETMKRWVAEELPTRRGRQAASCVRTHVNEISQLSASLRLGRADQGNDPAALGRTDIVAFLHRLQHLESTGQLTAYQRRAIVRHTAMVLRDCRALGFTHHGQPMAGLPDGFTVRQGDIPKEPDKDEEPGRALPPEILRQLAAVLPQLEQRSAPEFRVAVQLLMDTGRRPNEICMLPWDCLEEGADGKHALVYADFKNHRVGLRLAIPDATAKVIRDQQQAVRARFPATPVSKLALLPRTTRNPDGTQPILENTFGDAHRHWVDALPPLLLDDEQRTEFDKAKVVAYAYRHSYAQRHADAGTPVDLEFRGWDAEGERLSAENGRAAGLTIPE